MNHKILHFDNQEYELKLAFQNTPCSCGEIDITLVHATGEEVCKLIAWDDMRPCLDELLGKGKKVLNNKLSYNSSEDVGAAWSRINYVPPIQDERSEEEHQKYVEESSKIMPFMLWSTPHSINTWLYNSGTNIIFEVTPSYPWLFRDPEPREDFYSYEEFVKNYKPIFVQEMSRETLEEWLRIALAAVA